MSDLNPNTAVIIEDSEDQEHDVWFTTAEPKILHRFLTNLPHECLESPNYNDEEQSLILDAYGNIKGRLDTILMEEADKQEIGR